MTSPLSRLKELEERATVGPIGFDGVGLIDTKGTLLFECMGATVWDIELAQELRNAAPHLLDALQKGEALLRDLDAERQFHGVVGEHPSVKSFRAALAKLGEG